MPRTMELLLKSKTEERLMEHRLRYKASKFSIKIWQTLVPFKKVINQHKNIERIEKSVQFYNIKNKA